MFVARGIQELNQHLKTLNSDTKSVGFVPTMGALHHGHLALVNKAALNNDISVCSIFVNPTQFNEKKDFEKYPRNDAADIKLLQTTKLDIVYFPYVEEIYPKGSKDLLEYDDKYLFSVFEGEFRPGHFLGVVTVVMRLFEHIKPQSAYFGLKDYQQYLVIKRATVHYFKNTNVIGVSTVRNIGGLALSSRNKRLNTQELKNAEVISDVLQMFEKGKGIASISSLKTSGFGMLKGSGLEPEYLALCNASNLMEIDTWERANEYVVVCAAFVGEVRLIDNLSF